MLSDIFTDMINPIDNNNIKIDIDTNTSLLVTLKSTIPPSIH